jgi:hypothetical protein
MPGRGCTCGACQTCYQRAWRAANPDKVKAARQRYYKRTKARQREKAKQADRAKVYARNQVNNAIKGGRLVRGPCEVCGKENTDAHHDDYDKPLEVRWLCPSHHHLLHPGRT